MLLVYRYIWQQSIIVSDNMYPIHSIWQCNNSKGLLCHAYLHVQCACDKRRYRNILFLERVCVQSCIYIKTITMQAHASHMCRLRCNGLFVNMVTLLYAKLGRSFIWAHSFCIHFSFLCIQFSFWYTYFIWVYLGMCISFGYILFVWVSFGYMYFI